VKRFVAVGVQFAALVTAIPAVGGDRDDGARLLARAQKVSIDIPIEDRKITLAQIAAMQAALGRFDAAIATATAIDDPEARIFSVRWTATAQAKSGDFEGALHVARRFHLESPITLEVALAQGRAGQWQAAIHTLAMVGDPSSRARGYLELGVILRSRNERTAADVALRKCVFTWQSLQTSDKVDQSELAKAYALLGKTRDWESLYAPLVTRNDGILGRNSELAEFAEELVRIGACDCALELIKVAGTDKRSGVSEAIWSAALERGDDALNVLPQLQDFEFNDYRRSECVSAELQHRRYESALKVARGISEPAIKAAEIAKIARESRRSGDATRSTNVLNELRRAAEQILDPCKQVELFARLSLVEHEFGQMTEASNYSRRGLATALEWRDREYVIQTAHFEKALDSSISDLIQADRRADAITLLELWLRHRPKARSGPFGIDEGSLWTRLAIQSVRLARTEAVVSMAKEDALSHEREITRSGLARDQLTTLAVDSDAVWCGLAQAQCENGKAAEVIDWVDRLKLDGSRKADIFLAAAQGVLRRLKIRYEDPADRLRPRICLP
jgi:hypothetical protein